MTNEIPIFQFWGQKILKGRGEGGGRKSIEGGQFWLVRIKSLGIRKKAKMFFKEQPIQ